jgi:hypothetical protein
MEGLVGALIFGLLLMIPGWKIFKQAGMSPAWSLFVFVPGLGFLIIYVILAFARWPTLEAQQAGPRINERT